MNEPDPSMFPPAVYTIWWIGLIVTLAVFVPLAVYLLHRTLRAARSIEYYAAEALAAAAGIAGNTVNVKALDQTLETAVGVLGVTGRVEKKLGLVATTLAARAKR